jgi:hypothetical protein
MKKLLLIFCLILTSQIEQVSAQNTVGLLSYDQTKAFDGYNLMFPHNQPNVYLIDNCGEIAHIWEDEPNFRPGNTVYLTDEGLLYKTKRDAIVANDRMWAGGGGAILEIRDWDNNLLWDFEMNNDSFRLHHDFTITDKGTIIAIAWELKTADECVAAGRDTSTLARGEMWPDWILEIDPGLDSIIWEWHTWDHLIQDFDPSKANFGVVADHPELIDVNYGRPNGHPDWMHGNSLDYNPLLKQIMLSVPTFDEVWIIDHTTTTSQAAGHFGGFSNIGGDLMYRWGNPQTYGNGDSTDHFFFFQHDAHWIDDFLDFSHPQYGKIAVFNNRAGSNYSTVNTIIPPWDMYEWRYLKADQKFLPTNLDLTITHPDTTKLWSTGMSSTQWLPNGNMLIMSGRFGYAFELTPDNEIVWEYKTPLRMGSPATQGDSLSIANNLTFRMKRYPSDFPAFAGKDLSGKGWIELSPDTHFCAQIISSIEEMDENAFKVYPNPASDFLTIEWDGMFYEHIEVYDMVGHRVAQYRSSGSRKSLDVSLLLEGIYFVTILTENARYSRKVLIQR